MTDHPLTDDILISRFLKHARKFNSYTFDYTADGMRAAYDLAIDHMSQWVEENGHEYVTYDYELGCQSNLSQMITDLKEAMRPTTTQEDN